MSAKAETSPDELELKETRNALATTQDALTDSENARADAESRLALLREHMNRDPARMAFPPLLPMELALKVASVEETCTAYGVTRDQFAMMIKNPAFQKEYKACVEKLAIDGMSFKVKAQLQAEDYLATAFQMVKDPNTSPAVRADLIKSTVRWAGYEKKAEDVNSGTGFNIVLNLGQGQQTQVNVGK